MSEKRFLPVFDRYEPRVLDHTAIKTFKECPRKYFYRIVLGRTSKKSHLQDIFNWGSAIHKFMEALGEGKDLATASTEASAIYTQPPPDSKWSFLNIERFAKTLRHLYDDWMQERNRGQTKILAVEQPFSVQMPDGIATGGRFDSIIELNGRLWIRDWKTTSKQANYFAMGLDPNDQAYRYIYALSKLHGRKVDGIIFHCIQNMKSVGPKSFVHTVGASSEQLAEWEHEQLFIHKQLQACRDEDVWPKHEVSCAFCDYRTVCTQPGQKSAEYKLKTMFDLKPWKHENVEQKVETE